MPATHTVAKRRVTPRQGDCGETGLPLEKEAPSRAQRMKPLVVVFSLVGAWTVACDSGSNVASTANSAGNATEFAARYCQIIEPCCADAGLSTSGNSCFNQIAGTAADGQYNPAAGQDCLSA